MSRVFVLAALLCLVEPTIADVWDDAVEAPPDHVILKETVSGWVFVPKKLKAAYDRCLDRLETLQAELDRGSIDVESARISVVRLQKELKLLRQKIDANRVEVEGSTVYRQTESIEFELGKERRLAITANHVKVAGWEGPKVKVELEKLVLMNDDSEEQDQLDAIRISHNYGLAEFAGQTDEQWEAQEAEFIARNGESLTAEQLENRRVFVDEIRRGFSHHRDLLGKKVDQITVTGLDYQSNKVISKSVRSAGGHAQVGSVRQRYGRLTVFVPECVSVCVRGARQQLIVENLKASLTLVDEDSTDSDPRGTFQVVGLEGNLICRNFPLNTADSINGDVDIESTTEFAIEGAGTTHQRGLRTLVPGRPFEVSVRKITGDVRLRYGRVQLEAADIGGKINIANDFGNTRLLIDHALAISAHRVTSESGRIDVEIRENAWAKIPIVAATNHGGATTNLAREEFDDFHLSGEDRQGQVRRDWSGFRTPSADETPFSVFELIDRFAAISENRDRSDGLDLVTRSGTVTVVRKPNSD